ncbi:hypothetical protein AOLI_G00157780 [Acnodon oligacanthus]
MQAPLLFPIFFLLHSLSCSEDTVAEDLGIHQLQRLVDLLTVHECEELFLALSHPGENIFKQLERLSAEKNQLRLLSRTQRDTGDKETHCRPALTDWIQTHGEQTYYDRLSRTLQQIGRTDIAIEVGKNINQDKTLGMQRYVEEYHEQVNRMAPYLTAPQTDEGRQEETPQYSTREEMGLSWKKLDLVVERKMVPPYQHHLLDRVWPLLYGLIFGFVGALLVSMLVLLFTIHVCLCDQQKSLHLSCPSWTWHQRHHRHNSSSNFTAVTSSERIPLKHRDLQSEAVDLNLLV